MDGDVLLRIAVSTHVISARYFVSAEAFDGCSYAGFMDGFLHWYHGLFGISFPERDDRPRNLFDYEVLLPD